ncbi:beta-glucosidase [Sphingobacterium olei]|uniref:Beta-glucosidase n=1 Tax=Sphingobacterium olei TaxID=2571155 RepID=A0A4U0NYN6_9SPHI|nr:glycoside hydrolase family 3 C-terminal domain-containing protein [Sphingobacterium olei]TJZ59935.1 beta-glucosidase [Sphingobacterium olei]
MQKSNQKVVFYFTLLMLGLVGSIKDLYAQKKYPQFGIDPLNEVIAAMTIEEKALMVTGAKRREVYPIALPGKKQKNIVAVGGYTYPFLHLGIPPIYLSDGPAGVRIAPKRMGEKQTYYATAFPVATLVASGWDTSLSKEIGEAMGHEAREYGVDILLAPAMNIHRDPLGGRSFEYYSEDPLLTGKMASAFVQGIQSQGVGASIKHFAANNQETSRRYINTILSERALREIYLEGYRIAVQEAKPWTVMSSYNKINGVYTPQSKELLVDILRKEWGFDGFVLTDWYGGDDPVEQMKAHNDLLMPGLQVWTDTIAHALRYGDLSMDVVDQNIANILNVALKTGTWKNYHYTDKPDFEKSKEIARRVARESMVLLKNEHNVLPLNKGSKSIALFGNYSYKNLPGGTGSGAVNYAHAVSVAEGLNHAGFKIDPTLAEKYMTYLEKGKLIVEKADSLITAMPQRDSILGELQFSNLDIETSAKESDVAFISIMRIFGEGGDRKIDHFNLTNEEYTLIDRVSNAYHAEHKKVVVLLNVGGVVETASWKDKVDGILLTWQSGQEGGHAVADLVSGRFTPAGKLPTTFPVRYTDVPSAKNFPGTPARNPTEVVYEEDIYVGYRYYETFDVKTSFPFGFGLSYTAFDYTDFKVKKASEGRAHIEITVKNVGQFAGKEIIQVYAKAPIGKLDHPEKELKAFGKTRLLQPGESQTLRFEITPRMLSSFDTDASAWVAEKGSYDLMVGTSAASVVENGKFRLKKRIVTEKVSKSLAPQVEIKALQPAKRKR